MHKNYLQEYAQRLAIALPLYTTVNNGQQHRPQFASSVYIQGMTHHSSQMFHNRKAAEQDAARVALDYLRENKTTIDGDVVPKKSRCNRETENIGCSSCSMSLKESTFNKSTLHEYAAKLKLDKPSYNTAMTGPPHSPAFSSSVCFSGIIYTGGLARKKKDAEQRAARKVVEALLSSSSADGAEKVLLEISNSKAKHDSTSRQKSCGAPTGLANGASKNAPGSASLVQPNEVKPHVCADATGGGLPNDTPKSFTGSSFLVQLDEENHHACPDASKPAPTYGASKCDRGETEKVGFSLAFLKDSTICKFIRLILHEYAAMLKLDKPSYETVEIGMLHSPMFSSSVNFAGITYTGGLAQNKKDAERRAALKVVEALLLASSASDVEKLLLGILKSKIKYDPISGQKSCDVPAGPENDESNCSPGRSFLVQPDEVNDHARAYASGGMPTNSTSKSIPRGSFVVHLDEVNDHARADETRPGPSNGASKCVPRNFSVQLDDVNHHPCADASIARKRLPQKIKGKRTEGIKRKRQNWQ